MLDRWCRTSIARRTRESARRRRLGSLRCGRSQSAIELIDGIATTSLSGLPPDIGENAPGLHPNGVYEIDHLVIITSSTPRTVAAFTELGLERRGDRTVNHAGDAVDMTFLWAGQTLLEIAGPAAPDDGGKPARIAGLAYSTSDIDAAAALLGDG